MHRHATVKLWYKVTTKKFQKLVHVSYNQQFSTTCA